VRRERGRDDEASGEERAVLGTDTYLGAQILTFAIPLGTLFVVGLWMFFQRRPNG
jgi:hypothetical protein